MKKTVSIEPTPVTVVRWDEPEGEKCMVYLMDNIVKTGESAWEMDHYGVAAAYTPALEQEVKADFAAWVQRGIEQEQAGEETDETAAFLAGLMEGYGDE